MAALARLNSLMAGRKSGVYLGIKGIVPAKPFIIPILVKPERYDILDLVHDNCVAFWLLKALCIKCQNSGPTFCYRDGHRRYLGQVVLRKILCGSDFIIHERGITIAAI